MDDPTAHMPPSDLDAEAAVLSAVLLDPLALPKVVSIVAPEAFYAEAHRQIFGACLWLSEAGLQVDVVQVATRLKETGRIAQVGGMAYLTEILNAAPAVRNVVAYAETVARKARVRRLQALAQRLAAEGREPLFSEDEWIDNAERMIHEIVASRTDTAPLRTMRSVVRSVFEKLKEAFDRAEVGTYELPGIRTGFDALDEMTGGLYSGESTVLAARPGIGKTAFVMNVASYVAHQGNGVIVFSLEMPDEQIATRALCSAARVDVRKARVNKFDKSDWKKIESAALYAATSDHYYLVDRPSSLADIRSYARARASDMARDGVKLKLVVVDYLQLMNGRGGAHSREEAVSENARGLKLIAKELDCAVLALSQLNRGVESRNDKRPMLSDLRESGAIEEAADCVIGMYRDDYYHEKSKTPGVVELILLKHRHGPTGTVDVGFEARSTTFFNLRDVAAQ